MRTIPHLLALTCLLGVLVFAQQQSEEDAQALAKKLANPISDMVSIPFQYSWENGLPVARRTPRASRGAWHPLGLPMNTDPALGSGKWSAGPTAVGLYINGPWVTGMRVNHLWSVADTGDGERPT